MPSSTLITYGHASASTDLHDRGNTDEVWNWKSRRTQASTSCASASTSCRDHAAQT